MKKKSMLLTGVALLVLSVTSVSLAGPMGGGMGGGMGRGGMGGMGMGPGMQGQPPVQLTEQQQADWKAWQEKNLQLRKEYLGNLVKSGALTQEQVDARIKAMEANHAFRAKNGFVAPGAMYGAKLTDEQKVEMKKLFEQRMAIRKEALASYVKSGQITQAQADSQLQRMQERFNYNLENGFGGGRGGRGGRGMGGGMGRGGMGGGPRF
ncbi:MAG: DUF2680 domain-containing protein [Negativicutes bacterium]